MARKKSPARYHVIKKSTAQIQREIDAVLARPAHLGKPRKKRDPKPDYDVSTGEGQKRMMFESVGMHHPGGRIDTSRQGDYGADPVGDGTFRMVPSGDIVSFEERLRRLPSPKLRSHLTKKRRPTGNRKPSHLGKPSKKRGERKPRIVFDVVADTPAGYRWLLAHVRGATNTPEGFAVTNESDWEESLSAAGATEIK